MLTEIIEYGHKIKGEVKAIRNKIKIYREPTVKGRKQELKSTGLDQKEEINIQPEQNEKTRIQKSEERLRNLWDILHLNAGTLNVPTSKS